MMRRHRGMIFLWMGAIIAVFIFSGCSRVEYDQYSSRDKKLSVMMDYPKGWSFDEEHGARGAYVQVVFLEPAQLKKPLRAMMVVTIKDESKIRLRAPNVGQFGNDLLKRRLILKDGKKISSFHLKFLGFEAGVINFSYSLPAHPDRMGSKYVSIQERAVFFKRGHRFYTLRYVNEKKDFGRYEKVFMRCINTLKFKDAPR